MTVMWQPKAWYDNLTCNKWVALYAIAEIKKADLGVGQRHLILCDNLAGALALAHALTDLLIALAARSNKKEQPDFRKAT